MLRDLKFTYGTGGWRYEWHNKKRMVKVDVCNKFSIEERCCQADFLDVCSMVLPTIFDVTLHTPVTTAVAMTISSARGPNITLKKYQN
jgi:hypothetical protein